MYESLKSFLIDDFWIMPATPKYIDKGIPYITSKNIKNGKIDYSNINYISKEDYENISKNRPIKVNDILISMIGTIGETAVVTDLDGDFYGQNMFLIRLDNKKIYQGFFLNYFKSSFVKKQLFSKQNKSTQSYLKANHIEELRVPVINIEEQKKISDKLDKIQMMIDVKKEQISLLNQLIKSQFVEMFVEENNYKILKDICEFVTVGIANSATQAYRDSGVVLFRNQNILENKLDETDLLYIDDVFSNKYKNKLLKENDILATRTGYPGVACLVPKRYEGAQTFTTLIARLKKDKQINPIYICHFINSKYGKEFVASNKVGVAQQNLGAKTFELMPIKIPPIELQNKFAQIVEQIDKQKFEFEKSLKKLEELQASLMQEYFG